MKKLLILGGFPQMIDIVMTAREMGIYTVVADISPTSSAKRFADKSYDVSTDRIDELTAICEREGIDGVFTGFEDFNIHIAERLCQILGLPFYATREQLAVITDKIRFKAKCRECGVPTVPEYALDEALEAGKYPYIVKPADSYGSRGITVASCREELVRGYERATAVSRSGSAVIERFITSSHGVELFYTVVGGNIHLSATADRYTYKNGRTSVPLPVAEVFPSILAEQMRREIDPALRNMLKDIGIENGPVLIQALYENGEFFVYEMAYRLTGEQHYRLFEKQGGVGISRMMIALALGEDVSSYDNEELDDDKFIYPSVNYAVLLEPGVIRFVDGLDRVYKIEEVISYNLTHGDGDVIRPSGDYSHMLIRVNMVARDYGSLCRAVEEVNSYVRVVSEDGRDMVSVRFSLPNGI